MKIINIKVCELVLAEENVRIHTKNQIEEYKRSLNKFGQTKNAVVDENNKVLIGNGLVIAARELGWEEVSVIKRTDLSENDKLKLMVSDNKIFGLGIDNLDVVDEIFERLKGDLDIPGYDEEMLKNMVAESDAVTETLTGYGSLPESEINALKSRPAPTEHTEESTVNKPAVNKQETAPTDINNDNQEIDGTNDKILIKCPKCGDDVWLSKDALRQLLY